ncbi:hypothetical protein OH540_21190 [Streptomyces sp. BPPL-273]|uniref:hypothetical protein n=1 Tax=Streptomyces sp. BPPL-273 TaxID=2987533 RepID=UPI0024AF4B53|nr:hypothetical protein [Streptomyces sp. BPPL-273]WHM32421.1 hypothetical protein OH540_21190 [Streptomyces sp. BPPL-273]
MQETVPVRPDRPDGTHSLWTQQEQDRHWADLCESMGVPGQQRPRRPADSTEAAA